MFDLIPHPASPPSRIVSVTAGFERSELGLRLSYSVDGARALKLPKICEPKRRDGLWQETCFEAFVAMDAGGYLEFNFSPCADWAAYRFDSYREGMRDLDLSPPVIAPAVDGGTVRLDASITLLDVGAIRLALTAVIEEIDGTKSYWALRHPAGDKPDFHHPDCFALELPPPTEA